MQITTHDTSQVIGSAGGDTYVRSVAPDTVSAHEANRGGGPHTVSASVSSQAELLGALSRLGETDRSTFSSVVKTMAESLRTDANSAATDVTRSAELHKAADRLDEASVTGDVSRVVAPRASSATGYGSGVQQYRAQASHAGDIAARLQSAFTDAMQQNPAAQRSSEPQPQPQPRDVLLAERIAP